jgi:hypothetical protein
MEETRALYSEIMQAAGPGPEPSGAAGTDASYQQVLLQLTLARQELDQVRQQLQYAAELAERLEGRQSRNI